MTATPLIVFAHADEAECFAQAGVPHLVTGVGKINATLSLTEVLLRAEPGSISRVVVLGTAGAISDAVMTHLAPGARVVICGTASIASWDPIPLGPRVERHLLVKRARMQGILVFDYAARYDEALAHLIRWVREGRLRYREDILQGIEHAPGAIAGLYRGGNLGKRLISIAEA